MGPSPTPTPTTKLNRITHRPVLRRPAHVQVTRTRYQDMPCKATEHRPLEVHVNVKVLQVPPTLPGDTDQDKQPPVNPLNEHDTHK